jgi:2-keto-4-pentenoate hydratase/2-oxohepta-3-ene-1,7-dioic acid hydratase in catechol pathway
MRIVRFQAQGSAHYGILEDDSSIARLSGPPFHGTQRTQERFRSDDVRLLAPCEPSKIVGVGLNYRDHAEELGMELPQEPQLFLKPETSIIGPYQQIRYPSMARRVDFEAELAIVIGAYAKKVPVEDAARVILGYTCFNDVTARDLQFKDVQYTRAKGFDTFAPIGPWIETDLDPLGLTIESYLNGERKQHSSTACLLFDPCALVSYISHIMTLRPGDVIASGTPAGVGPMKPGDRIEVRIERIGSLVNEVVDEMEHSL